MNVMLRKDSTGAVTGVIMPNQAEHSLEYRTYFNGYRLIYSGLHQQIWEYDSNSNLRRVYFPHQRLITYQYDENNRLISSFADGCRTSVHRENSLKRIRMEYPRGQIHEQIYAYHSDGFLNYFIDFYDDSKNFLLIFIKYHSTSSFDLRLIPSKTLSINLLENYPSLFQSNYSLQFDGTSGHLQSNSFVRFTYPTIYESFIKDHSNLVTLSRRIDEYKRLKEIHFSSKNQKRLTIEFIYNNKQFLLEQIKVSVNDLEKFIYTYQYDQLKRLKQIRKNDLVLDNYQYDLNRNLNSTMQYKSIEYNQWNQLIQVKTNENQTWSYKYDSNGFLHWISQEKLFLFNSFGLLIKYKSNQLVIDYIYDSEQRLIIKSYPLTGFYLQFIYGNPLDRRSISHIYNSQLKCFTTIFYDDQHRFVGFEQNERKFFVITDAIGSPLFIYDHQGLLVQEKFYGLYGMKLIEKNYQEKIFFPFGYAGLLIDEDLNCAFEKTHGRLYDLVLGRYLVPTFPSTWWNKRTFRPELKDPLQEMNLYQIDPLIYDVNEIFFQRLHQNGKTTKVFSDIFNVFRRSSDILNQLKSLNYDFSHQFNVLSSFHQANTLLNENPLISSSFFSDFAEHYSVSYPNRFSYSIAHLHHEHDFWLNRTLIIDHRTEQIEYVSMNSPDDLLTILFNQSIWIPYRKQNEIHFFQHLDRFPKIKSQLNQGIFRQWKINVRYPKKANRENPIELEFLILNSTLCHIHFGSTFDEEYRRLIEQNLSQINSIVWQRERTHLMENARFYHLHTWSQNEIDELISHGYLNNYTVTYRYDPRHYPEIIDDPSNVRFQFKI